jgi:3-oxoacyl-[acyl-carrier protein] reductase
MNALRDGALTGRTALVTGASKGIGAGIAEAFGRAGANVVVNYASDRDGAEAVVDRVEAAGAQAVAVRGSVADESELEALFDEARDALGPLDILVNNAGILRRGALEDSTAELFHQLFDVNVLGLLLATQRFAADAVEGASIVNISALTARIVPPGQGIYTATKASVDVLTQTHAKELGPRGIRVNAISPGLIVTEGTKASGLIGSEMERARIAQTPLRRAGEPDDIASVAVFLTSDASRYVTGQILAVSGGV